MTEKQLPATTAGISNEVIAQIQEIQKSHAIGNLIDLDEMQRSFTIAQGIGRLSQTIMANEEVVQCLMYLQGKKLGFRTDKEYAPNVVVDCVVEALMRGLPLTGNCFNIIAGNLYVPREGFDHLLDNLKGLTDFFIDFGDYTVEKKVAKVQFQATWKYKGEDGEMTSFVPVRVNDGMIVDAIMGKSTRKIMHRVYTKITKSAAYFEARDLDEINTTIVVDAKETSKLTEHIGKIGKKEKSATDMMPDFRDHS